MTAIQIIEAHGIPRVEYRHEPEEPQLITIEFRPDSSKYEYPQPEFVFQESVALAEQYNYCQENQLSVSENMDIFRICALKLAEHLIEGKLQSPPRWVYGIRSARGTRELSWAEEDELISARYIDKGIEF